MHNLVMLAAQASTEPAAMTQGELIAWIAGIATAVATVVTAAMTLWFRMMDKPSPEFEIVPQQVAWHNMHGPMGLPVFEMFISNVGSGSARMVSILGSWSRTKAKKNGTELPGAHDPVFEVGQTIEVIVTALPKQWENLYLIVTWHEASHLFWWRYSKYKAFRLTDLFDQPVMMDYSTNTTTGIFGESPAPEDSQFHSQVQERETRLERSGIVELDSSKKSEFRRTLRKLSKAGWRWRQHLTKTDPDETDS